MNPGRRLLATENPYNAKVMEGSGLDRAPDEGRSIGGSGTFPPMRATRTFRPRINDAMGHIFVAEKLIDHYIASLDSTLLKAGGHVWHASSMEKGVVP